MSEVIASGRCLCGATRYELHAEPLWVAYCHCESCRRATGAPVSTYLGCAVHSVTWLGDEPRLFASSHDARRGSCASCCSPMTYESSRWAGEVHLHISTLDDPGRFPPRAHVYFSERIDWFEVHDNLPRFATTRVHDANPDSHGPLEGQ